MTTDDALSRIDDTLEAWEDEPDTFGWQDSARWAGAPNEGEWPSRFMDNPFARAGFARSGYAVAPTAVMRNVGVSLSVAADAFEAAMQEIANAMRTVNWDAIEKLFSWLDEPVPRPMASVERTNSPQQRAGSRRTKRLARLRRRGE